MVLRSSDMLYLEHTRNRVLFIIVSSTVSAILMASIQGIIAVGIVFPAVINILIYYAYPTAITRSTCKNAHIRCINHGIRIDVIREPGYFCANKQY